MYWGQPTPYEIYATFEQEFVSFSIGTLQMELSASSTLNMSLLLTNGTAGRLGTWHSPIATVPNITGHPLWAAWAYYPCYLMWHCEWLSFSIWHGPCLVVRSKLMRLIMRQPSKHC